MQYRLDLYLTLKKLRADSLGKTLCGALGRLEIDVPAARTNRRRPRPQLDWADEILDRLST